MTSRHWMLALALATMIAAFAAPGTAIAGSDTGGQLTWPDVGTLGSFSFHARGETVAVNDSTPDHYAVLVELWWPSHNGASPTLQRTCWDRNGAHNSSGHCDFSIPENVPVTFYISEANWRSCVDHRPASSCKDQRFRQEVATVPS